jgi:erythronate-4-phosphate dehydrogenase
LIIDCWENEPAPDPELLNMAALGTPHIAGYSRDGKAKGTRAAVRAVSRYFGLGIDHWEPVGVEPPDIPVIQLDGRGRSDEEILADAILATYEIERDDTALRDKPDRFEQLRGDYPVRREFASFSIRAVGVGHDAMHKLGALGFSCPAATGPECPSESGCDSDV